VIKLASDLPRDAFRLTWVGLPNNKQVTDAGLAAFAGCKSLVGLQLEGTTVTDAGLLHLKDCTNLTGLDLTSTKVTDTGLTHLKDCTNLTYLRLADTQATRAWPSSGTAAPWPPSGWRERRSRTRDWPTSPAWTN
jgi:hypothetical protein